MGNISNFNYGGMSNNIPLTWDDLADFYKLKTGNSARIRPMNAIYQWDVKQEEIKVMEDSSLILKTKENQMTSYLITPTLLNSLKYYLGSDYANREDFLKTLSRERFEPNEAMQKGIDFENDIQKICSNTYSYYNFDCPHEDKSVDKVIDYEKLITKLGEKVKGGYWQESVKKEIEVAGTRILLYGRCDVIKEDTVFDIKYTKNYNLGKFQNSTQHLIYMFCSGLDKFKYLVSDLKSYWIEEYVKQSNIEAKLRSEIIQFFEYLDRDKEAKELFYNKWKSK